MSLIWDALDSIQSSGANATETGVPPSTCPPKTSLSVSSLFPVLDFSIKTAGLRDCLLESVETMLKSVYTNGSGASAILRHRNIKHLLLLVLILFFVSFWLIFTQPTTPAEADGHPQATVLIHKTAKEIDVLPWPEERWYVGPRNESDLEKAALIMLVR